MIAAAFAAAIITTTAAAAIIATAAATVERATTITAATATTAAELAITATTMTAAVTTVAATVAATVTTAAAATTVGGAFFLRTGDIDLEGPAHEFLIFQLPDGLLGLLSSGHRHESKTARTTGKAVTHNGDFSNSAGFAEQFLQIIFHGIPREVAYKHLVFH